MSVTYDTNWMGPVSIEWYKKRGLTRNITETLTEESALVVLGKNNVGDVIEYDNITTRYCAGRIDVRDDSKDGYDGWDEYSIAPMLEEDWSALGDWLWDLETEEQLSYDELMNRFEKETGHKIMWLNDCILRYMELID